jgi:hypothetical protein
LRALLVVSFTMGAWLCGLLSGSGLLQFSEENGFTELLAGVGEHD